MSYLTSDAEHEYLLFAMKAAGIGVWNMNVERQELWFDERCRELFGFGPGEIIPYNDVLRPIHPDDSARVHQAVQEALRPGSTGNYQCDYRIIREDQQDEITVTATGQAFFNARGEVYRFSGVVHDITERDELRRRASESEQISRVALESAEMGRVKLTLETEIMEASPLFIYHYSGLIGKSMNRQELFAHYHPDDIPVRDAALKELAQTGRLQLTARVVWADGSIHWIKISGKHSYDRNGKAEYVFATSQEITEEKEMFAMVAASEEKFRSVIQAAPAGMGLFIGRDLVIENPNQAFIEIVGKGPDIVGKPLREVMPELITEGQPFLKILDDVFTSGKMYQSFGDPVKIIRNGEMTNNYYNITYSPLFDAAGQVYGILDIAIDVTGEMLTRQQLEANERMLRSAVEVAELAVWSVDLPSGKINISEQLKAWLGLPENVSVKESFKVVSPADKSRVQEALLRATNKDSGGLFDEEFMLEATENRGRKIIHIQGRTFFDATGAPVKMSGIARDLTPQRQLQLELEEQVKQRTASLFDKNEELAVSNEQLLRSNEELTQFAYVASHDLQEPLRKIRVFSTMLRVRQTPDEEGKNLLDKIETSAERMSLLITDLLNLSGLMNSDSLWSAVNLNTVLKTIRKDFDLIIEEKRAKIFIGDVPVVQGINVQLTQLFYNLMSNALKFSSTDRHPEITVISMKLSDKKAKNFVPLAVPGETYHCISFSDNGIGFEEEYANKIFDIFKRLHGRAEYPGSGIGLALCKRIISNHRGHIHAKSIPGESATFYVILPEKIDNTPVNTRPGIQDNA